jgi:pimeloyl-ACP methyl ester carboxylesterase
MSPVDPPLGTREQHVSHRHQIFTSLEGEALVMADYEAAFTRWPAPKEASLLPTRHGRTWLVTTGSRQSTHLVLLHGSGSHAMTWVADVPSYTRHFRTHAVDIPGEPGRSEAVRMDWHSPACAEWLVDVLDGLGIWRTHLVGASQGGWAALRFATLHPERVSRLVLLSPAGIVPARLSFLLTMLATLPLGRRGRDVLTGRIIGDTALDQRTTRHLRHLSVHTRPRVGAMPIFTDADLERLTMPVLCALGEHDAVFPARRIATRIARVLPQAELRVFPGQGHLLSEVRDEVLRFLLR